MKCRVYDNLRSLLFQNVGKVDVSFHQKLSDLKKAFVYLMSSKNHDIINALGNFVWDAFKQRESLLCLPTSD